MYRHMCICLCVYIYTYVHTIYMTVYSQTCTCVHVSCSVAAKMQNTFRMDLALVTKELSMRFEMTDQSHFAALQRSVCKSHLSVIKNSVLVNMHKDQKSNALIMYHFSSLLLSSLSLWWALYKPAIISTGLSH